MENLDQYLFTASQNIIKSFNNDTFSNQEFINTYKEKYPDNYNILLEKCSNVPDKVYAVIIQWLKANATYLEIEIISQQSSDSNIDDQEWRRNNGITLENPNSSQEVLVKKNIMGSIGLIFAILCLIFCWWSKLNILFLCLGFIFSIIGLFKSPREDAAAGFILSILDIVVIITASKFIAAYLSEIF